MSKVLPTKILPAKPNLEQLKKQAKELHQSLQRSEPQALERLKPVIPKLHDKIVQEPTTKISLNDAYYIIAREYGAPSWDRLKRYVEIRMDPVISFIKAVCDGNHNIAKEIFDEKEEELRKNLLISAMLGDKEKIVRHIQDHPEWVTQHLPPLQVEPLFYVSYSAIHKLGEKYAHGLEAIVKELLSNGANPNVSYTKMPEKWTLTALYGACGIANNPVVARLLLEAGANPNDNESLYHSTEHTDNECLKLLLAFNANPRKTNALPHCIDLENPKGVRLLLDHGADPNETLGANENALHWAVKRERSNEVLELLLNHCVDLEFKNNSGATPYQYAVQMGNTKAAEFLASKGANQNLNVTAQFIAACMKADRNTAESIMSKHPNIVSSLTKEESRALSDAAWKGKKEALKLMLEFGFDMNAKGEHGASVLHFPCWHGRVDLVEIILRYKPNLEAFCSEFGCTPFAWACHGAVNCRNPKGDYIGVIKRLLDDGAKLSYINKWGENLFPYENAEVANFLRSLDINVEK